MPIFLRRSDIYRIIQRELPLDVFPDGPPSAFYHTAEMDSYSNSMEKVYDNASGIYLNEFPLSCDSSVINKWETKVFGQLGDSSTTLLQRQTRIAQKLQRKPGIAKKDIEAIVSYTLPGVSFEVANWGCGHGGGGWVLDVSQLDLETYLNYDTQFHRAVGPQLCSDSPSAWGMTSQDWINLQTMAYTYEVRIYGVTLTAAQRTALDQALTAGEAARDTHVINDGLSASDMLND